MNPLEALLAGVALANIVVAITGIVLMIIDLITRREK